MAKLPESSPFPELTGAEILRRLARNRHFTVPEYEDVPAPALAQGSPDEFWRLPSSENGAAVATPETDTVGLAEPPVSEHWMGLRFPVDRTERPEMQPNSSDDYADPPIRPRARDRNRKVRAESLVPSTTWTYQGELLRQTTDSLMDMAHQTAAGLVGRERELALMHNSNRHGSEWAYAELIRHPLLGDRLYKYVLAGRWEHRLGELLSNGKLDVIRWKMKIVEVIRVSPRRSVFVVIPIIDEPSYLAE